jgi:DNA polymerase III subunit gamma/tau
MSDKLDLKYRPRRFDQVLGNHGVTKLLVTRSRSGTLDDQSMMLGGPKGCGKTSLARIIARAILCGALQDGEPCDECENCIAVQNETSDCVTELDAASQGSVERVRDMVKESDYSTREGHSPIYIIDEAQRLTAQAQDVFLKAVEERVFTVIFCTTEPHKIRAPIRSRLEEYPINAPTLEEVTAWLDKISQAEQIKSDLEALKIIAKINDCCPRSCVLALERLRVLGDVSVEATRKFFRFDSYELVDKILHNVDQNPTIAFGYLDQLSASESPSWIRDTMVQAIASGMRVDVGVKSNFPVAIRFFQVRLRGWLDLAHTLGAIEKPMMPDIEAALLRGTGQRVAPVTISEPVQFEPPKDTPEVRPPEVHLAAPKPILPSGPSAIPTVMIPAPVAVLTPKLNRVVEIDGISFSANERLTTLDDKISPSVIPIQNDPDVPPVELNTEHAPITEKEFIRGFVARIRK